MTLIAEFCVTFVLFCYDLKHLGQICLNFSNPDLTAQEHEDGVERRVSKKT